MTLRAAAKERQRKCVCEAEEDNLQGFNSQEEDEDEDFNQRLLLVGYWTFFKPLCYRHCMQKVLWYILNEKLKNLSRTPALYRRATCMSFFLLLKVSGYEF